jgi:F-type H+-transporting ATPase subunit delta
MEEIAHVYSRSLFEVASEQGKLDLIQQQLGQFADALDGNRELQVFFFSPYFSTEEKKDGLDRAVTEADPILLNFLELLVEKHRMPVIFRLRRQFDELWEREHQVLRVDVTSAVALDERVLEQISARVGEQTHRRVQLASHVDPDILGGIVLRVGNSILDTSIRNRLDNLRRQVAKAT